MSTLKDKLLIDLAVAKKDHKQVEAAVEAFNNYNKATTVIAAYISPETRENFEKANKEFIQAVTSLNNNHIITDDNFKWAGNLNFRMNSSIMTNLEVRENTLAAMATVGNGNRKFETFFKSLLDWSTQNVKNTESDLNDENERINERVLKFTSEPSLKEVSDAIKKFKEYSQFGYSPKDIKETVESLNNLLNQNKILDFKSDLNSLENLCKQNNSSEIEKILEGQRDKNTGKYTDGLVKKMEKFVVDMQKQKQIILQEQAQKPVTPKTIQSNQIVQSASKTQDIKKSAEIKPVLASQAKVISQNLLNSLNKLQEKPKSKGILKAFNKEMSSKEREAIQNIVKDIKSIPENKNYDSDLNAILLRHLAQNKIHKSYSNETKQLIKNAHTQLNSDLDAQNKVKP